MRHARPKPGKQLPQLKLESISIGSSNGVRLQDAYDYFTLRYVSAASHVFANEGLATLFCKGDLNPVVEVKQGLRRECRFFLAHGASILQVWTDWEY